MAIMACSNSSVHLQHILFMVVVGPLYVEAPNGVDSGCCGVVN